MTQFIRHDKWHLPDVVDPPGHLCFVVKVPNEFWHIVAFKSAIENLTYSKKWADDVAHRAALTSRVWQKIYDALKPSPCDENLDHLGGELDDCMKLRIDPTNSCIIQCFDDCSQTWGTFLDVSQCAPAAVSQQGPGGTPSAGDTNCYDVVLNANNQWRSPIPVKDGDTVTISMASGGWSGDTLNWHCPNGNNYLLGACTTAGATVGTDPAPTLAHMRMIASLNGTTWQDAYNTTLVIPPGTSPTNLLIQANDSNLADNVGSINFRVCIATNNPTNWTQDFDFTVSSGGWNPLTSAQAQWLVGTGWANNAPGGSPEDCVIQFTALHPGIVTLWDTVSVVSSVHQSYQGAQYRHNGTSIFSNNALAETPGGTLHYATAFAVAIGDVIQASWNISASPLGSVHLTSMHLTGTGQNPFIP